MNSGISRIRDCLWSESTDVTMVAHAGSASVQLLLRAKEDGFVPEGSMTLTEAKEKLSGQRAELRRFHVASLSVFGSVARGDAGEHSDIDLLVEFSEPVGLFEFARLKSFLEKVLGVRVDLVTPAALRESMRDTVLREAIRAA